MTQIANRTDTVTVIPLTGLDRELAYRVPEPLVGKLEVGHLVRIPLMSRTELGVVAKLGDDGELERNRLKYLYKQEQPFSVVREDGISLAKWMSVYYSAGLDSVFDIMIPRAIKKGMRLVEERYLKIAKTLDSDEEAQLAKRAPKQAKLYQFLKEQLLAKPLSRKILLQRLNITTAVADALVAKGILEEDREVVRRDAYMDTLSEAEQVRPESFALNEEQRLAIESLQASMAEERFQCHLLHGVTGSGKTEVYLGALNEALARGGSVIFLVPEVALTPQTVGRLRARLEEASGAHAVVWHSHLSDGERFDAWRALSNGDARIVVGARSAVFAPLQNVKLIIVDEEHEPAYKQDETPRYHGRDVAVYRAYLNNALCVLGSATPSLESLHNVAIGKYKVNYLRKRVDDRQLPVVHVVDMKTETARQKGIAVFSQFLVDKMIDRFERGEQTILFINRRGFDSSIHCPDCGFVAMCDHCDVTMTHHKADKVLRCHMCGAEEYVPPVCPKCRSPKIHYRGSGTQKVEAFANKILPKARIVRIDTDTMQRKHHFRELLNEFRLGKIHVLVGTQMIAKGLDFPNVTLVGLMDSDLSLHLPDFRASERTFQLLVQVSGRSGRGDRSGEVVVQTYLPYAPPIQFGRHQDFDGFAEQEMEHRKEFGYPPYRHLIHHLFRSKNKEKLIFYTDQWAKHVEKELAGMENVEIRGPAPCPIERVQDFYRYQLWYFVPNVSRIIPYLNHWRKTFKWDKEIIEVLDVDALHLI